MIQIKQYDRILSLDYGSKFTGIGIYQYKSDPYPLGYGRLPSLNYQLLLDEINKIIIDENIVFLVLGVPYLLDGQSTNMTKKILKLKEDLQKIIQIPIYEVDETLTSVEAKERMLNSPLYNFKIDMNKIDEISAVIILEEFLKINALS